MFDIISMQLLIIQFAVQVCLRDEPSTGVIITIMTLQCRNITSIPERHSLSIHEMTPHSAQQSHSEAVIRNVFSHTATKPRFGRVFRIPMGKAWFSSSPSPEAEDGKRFPRMKRFSFNFIMPLGLGVLCLLLPEFRPSWHSTAGKPDPIERIGVRNVLPESNQLFNKVSFPAFLIFLRPRVVNPWLPVHNRTLARKGVSLKKW